MSDLPEVIDAGVIGDGIPADTSQPDSSVPVQRLQTIQPEYGQDRKTFNYAQQVVTGVPDWSAPDPLTIQIDDLYTSEYKAIEPQTDVEAGATVRAADPVGYKMVVGKEVVKSDDGAEQVFPLYQGGHRASGDPIVPEPEGATFLQAASAGFQRENSIASMVNADPATQTKFDPDFDVTKEKQFLDPKYADYSTVLISAPNKDAFNARVRQIDSEIAMLEKANGNAGGYLGGAVAGAILDPAMIGSLLLLQEGAIVRPIVAGVRASRGLETAAVATDAVAVAKAAQSARMPIAAIAADEAIIGGASEAVPELLKQGTQITRTPEEAAINIGAATVLSGIISAGIVKFKRGQSDAALRQMEEHLAADVGSDAGVDAASAAERQIIERDAADLAAKKAGKDWEDSVAVSEGNTGGDSMGAARYIPATKEEYELTGAFTRALTFNNKLNPITRVMKSSSLAARRAMLYMIDSPYYHAGHNTGKRLTALGGSIESRARAMHDYALASALKAMDDSFIKYRGGGFEGNTAAIRDMLGQSTKLTNQQFKDEIGKAMRAGDVHPIPEVAEAAKAIRENVYTPMLEQMNELGMMGKRINADGEEVAGKIDPASDYARQYLNRIWNQDEIARNARIVDGNGNLVGGLQHKIWKHFEAKQKAAQKFYDNFFDENGTKRTSQEAQQAEYDAATFKEGLDKEVNNIRQSLKADIDTNNADHVKSFLGLKEKPKTLLQVLKENGGLFDGGGELAARDITNKAQPGLISKTRKHKTRGGSEQGGLSDDSLREVLFDNDFKFGAYEYGDIDLDKVYDAIAESSHNKIKMWDDNVAEQLDEKLVSSREMDDLREGGLHKNSTKDEIRDYVLKQRGSNKYEYEQRLHELNTKVKEAHAIRAKEIDEAEQLREFINMNSVELQNAAGQTVDNIRGIASGDIVNDVIPEGFVAKTKFLKSRSIDIPDQELGDFLVHDVERNVRAYLHSTVPEMEMTRTFGDTDMGAVLKQVRKEYTSARDAARSRMEAEGVKPEAIEKEMTRLDREEADTIKDLTAIQQKVLGKYGLPEDPNHWAHRLSKSVKQYNLLRMLGGMQLSALPDLARPIMAKGFMANARVFKALGSTGYKMALDEAKRSGAALEMILNGRVKSMAGLIDDGTRRTGFEKRLDQMSSGFGKITLMSQHNNFLKGYSAILIQDEILRAAKTLSEGGALTKKQIRDMARSGLDEMDLRNIGDEFGRGGISQHDGLMVPDTSKWADYEVVQAMRSAVGKSTDEIIVTVGKGDMPLWMSSEVGSHIMQFKSFMVSAHSKVLIAGLQQADAAAAEGLLMTMGLGYAVYALKCRISGREMSDDPQTLAWEAMDRGGLLGVTSEAMGITDKFTGGAVSKLMGKEQLSRFQSRNVVGSLLGASSDTIGGAVSAGRVAFTGEVSEGDVKEIRKMMPYQSLWYMNWLFSRIEDGAKENLVNE